MKTKPNYTTLSLVGITNFEQLYIHHSWPLTDTIGHIGQSIEKREKHLLPVSRRRSRIPVSMYAGITSVEFGDPEIIDTIAVGITFYVITELLMIHLWYVRHLLGSRRMKWYQ